MEWAIGAAVFGLGMIVTVLAMRSIKAKPRGGGGFMISLMMIIASVTDPAKAAAIEQLDRKNDIGDAEEGESGDRP